MAKNKKCKHVWVQGDRNAYVAVQFETCSKCGSTKQVGR